MLEASLLCDINFTLPEAWRGVSSVIENETKGYLHSSQAILKYSQINSQAKDEILFLCNTISNCCKLLF